MTLMEFMNDPKLHAEVREQLAATFGGARVRAPEPDEVIADALRAVRLTALDSADDMGACNTVDMCRAKALVLERFVEWLGHERRGSDVA